MKNTLVTAKTIVTAVFCKKCNTLVYSRARHDFRYCECGDVAIDGGRNYTKVSYNKDSDFLKKNITIFLSDIDIYNDWNDQINKLGSLKLSIEEFEKIS